MIVFFVDGYPIAKEHIGNGFHARADLALPYLERQHLVRVDVGNAPGKML
jgi:hypothetical protein